MDKLSLLIADNTDEFAQQLAEALQEDYRIRRCRNGKEALQYMVEQKPDVLILDLMISGLDGISLLHALAESGCQPMVLATTRLLSNYVIETAEALAVEYLMVKPCDPAAVADRVRDLSRRLRPRLPSISNPAEYVHNLLIRMHFQPSHRGFPLLRDAIVTMCFSPDTSLTKELYPALAKKNRGSEAQVERAIRNSIENAWSEQTPELWSSFVTDTRDCAPRPSNGTFINAISQDLRVKLGLVENGK